MNFLCTTNVSQHWHVVEIDLSRIILCMLHQTMKTFSSPNSNTMLEPIAFCTIRSIWHSSHSLWWEISICAQVRKLVSYAYFAFNKFVSLILHFHTIFRLWSHLSLVSTLCQSNQIPTYFSFRQLCILNKFVSLSFIFWHNPPSTTTFEFSFHVLPIQFNPYIVFFDTQYMLPQSHCSSVKL